MSAHIGAAFVSVDDDACSGKYHSTLTSNNRYKVDDGQAPSQTEAVYPPSQLLQKPQNVAALRSASTAQPTPTSPADLEMSRPSTPSEPRHATTIMQNWRAPPITKWRILSACLGSLGQGFSDSAPGALLPYIESHYSVNYAIVSMIFVANAVGFILAALLVSILDRKLGRPKTLILCEIVNILAFAVMIIPPPFPVFVIGYFAAGFGFATILALNNVFCANVAPATTILGAFHGAYGIGGTVAPLLATGIVNAGIKFSRFYAILLGIRILVGLSLGYTFWNWSNDTSSATNEMALNDRSERHERDEAVTGSTERSGNEQRSSSQLISALKIKVTLVGALFIFAYQGAEVSISGWVISFLITVRHGDPSKVGNVTAGFWGGIVSKSCSCAKTC